MKVAVYDTYVMKKDGTRMHFDILVPEDLKDEAQVYRFGQQYLRERSQEGQVLSSKECRFCHIRQASDKQLSDIQHKGYSIIEMEGCA